MQLLQKRGRIIQNSWMNMKQKRAIEKGVKKDGYKL